MPNKEPEPETRKMTKVGLCDLAQRLISTQEQERRYRKEFDAAKQRYDSETQEIELIKMKLKGQADAHKQTLNIITEVPASGGLKKNVRVAYDPSYPKTPFVSVEDIIT